MFKFGITTKKIKINFFCHTPDLRPPPDPTGVKILLARVSRVRVRVIRVRVRVRFRVRVTVTVSASGHPRGRGAQRF